VAASAAASRRALAVPSHPGGSAAADGPLQLRSGGGAHAAAYWIYESPRGRGRELVHSVADGADELLAGAAGERAFEPAVDERARLEPAKVQRLVDKFRHAAAGVGGEIRVGLSNHTSIMPPTSYSVIRPASVNEVIRKFIQFESEKQGADHFKELLREIENLSEEETKKCVRQFAERTNNGSPIFPWTTGMGRNEWFQKVNCWVFATVDLPQLYTRGIRDNTRDDLNQVAGNLDAFNSHVYKYPDTFKLDAALPEDLRTIFAVSKSEPGKRGSIELIDGAHRTINMLHNGTERITSSNAYVAELWKSGEKR
jgi:hypothetical protein